MSEDTKPLPQATGHTDLIHNMAEALFFRGYDVAAATYRENPNKTTIKQLRTATLALILSKEYARKGMLYDILKDSLISKWEEVLIAYAKLDGTYRHY